MRKLDTRVASSIRVAYLKLEAVTARGSFPRHA
jgi:hypothetical protein